MFFITIIDSIIQPNESDVGKITGVAAKALKVWLQNTNISLKEKKTLIAAYVSVFDYYASSSLTAEVDVNALTISDFLDEGNIIMDYIIIFFRCNENKISK